MFETYTLLELAAVAALGLTAGTLGGLLGVGGSVVMIPGLVWLLGAPGGAAPGEQHAFQAAAMLAQQTVPTFAPAAKSVGSTNPMAFEPATTTSPSMPIATVAAGPRRFPSPSARTGRAATTAPCWQESLATMVLATAITTTGL